jgi:hypothetical protein
MSKSSHAIVEAGDRRCWTITTVIAHAHTVKMPTSNDQAEMFTAPS